jgi:hypothetical protein
MIFQYHFGRVVYLIIKFIIVHYHITKSQIKIQRIYGEKMKLHYSAS